MLAVLFILIAFLLFSIALYPLVDKWVDAGIKKYSKKGQEKVCAHSNTSELSCWRDDEGKLHVNCYCLDCGKVLRGGGTKAEDKEEATRQSS